MTILFTVLGFIGVIVVVVKLILGTKRHGHALNIVYASYTFQRLADAERRAVQAVASNILGRLADSPSTRARTLDQLDAHKRYSLYALALAELNIPPAGNSPFSWQHTSHPLATPANMQSVIESFERDNKTKLDFKL
ncbi:MAG: hypothetical protein A2756_04160 [Candidatus Ryanbacteria bacterium RIFCSPHIGHO2_01_FULL_48_27]|nr:MAG: hypothetical protein A2756_04160 [Candidatus Ryanbacteria bacterium RIFCSPHIGHO2_01_FULL_48_27]